MDRTQKVVVETRKPNSTIDDLPDDVIIDILSRVVDRRDAARTSAVSRRWRYLSASCSSPGVLKLDFRDLFSFDDRQVVANRDENPRIHTLKEKFTGWVNRALLLHKGLSLGALIIRSTQHLSYSDDALHWIYYPMCKNVKALELDVVKYANSNFQCEFPKSLTPLTGDSYVGSTDFSFASLTSLRLVGFDIKDETVKHYLATGCPNLQHLCISDSGLTERLRFVDPLPNLRTLEVSECPNIKSLEILVTTHVSCTYQGKLLETWEISKNLTDLTLGGDFARSFVYEPKRHTSYSAQLVKLGLNFLRMVDHKPHQASSSSRDIDNIVVDPYWKIQRPELPRLRCLEHLELNFVLPMGKSIHFFLRFINGVSPLLKELRIKISYMVSSPVNKEKLGFPEEAPSTTLEGRRQHLKKLKAISMSGYVGCSIDDKFILRLVTNSSSVESVAIDTESEYYEQIPGGCTTRCGRRSFEIAPPCVFCTNTDTGARTRAEAKRRAKLLKSSFPSDTKAVLVVT